MLKVIAMGRVTKEPEVRYTQSGKCVCTFIIAVNREFKNEEGNYDADFVPVVVWGKAAELAGNSLDKGHRILVEGRLQNRSYEAKDGSKRYIAEIISQHIEFVERKSDVKPKTMDKLGTDVTGDTPFDENVPF
jgi:single-strand DNA-binding protein